MGIGVIGWKRWTSALLLVGVLVTAPLALACEFSIPDEPDVQEATTEGPEEFSGLYGHHYDLGGGRGLITLRRILDLALDDGLASQYTLQRYPLMYVVIIPGYANATYLDRGHGLLGTPQGFCAEIVRYQ